jgi:hypothetical protein
MEIPRIGKDWESPRLAWIQWNACRGVGCRESLHDWDIFHFSWIDDPTRLVGASRMAGGNTHHFT